jgi:hypothetical protein
VDPRIGSRMKQACTIEEDQTVEVVRNHEDGTRERWRSLPEGRTGNGAPGLRTPRFGTMEGRIWKPQERRPDGNIRRYGSGRDGKVGVKVKRVRATMHYVWHATRS